MYRSIFKNILVVIATITIAACGGGGGGGGSDYGGGGGGGGGYGNNPPTITNSTSSYSAVENQTGAFLVTASDSDGDALTYSITQVLTPVYLLLIQLEASPLILLLISKFQETQMLIMSMNWK